MSSLVIYHSIRDSLPQQPGVYKYFDIDNNLLYIGKAKNLKKRIASYFTKEHDNNRLRRLVHLIAKIDYTIVDTENDALLLENILIKKQQPKYNILLKDDKTYPYLCIKNEDFPRVFVTRNKLNDGSLYLGPFLSVDKLRTTLELIKHLFTTRTCNLVLSQKNIKTKKFKVCLEYHIGNCKGPCAGLQTVSQYQEDIQQIINIFKGKYGSVIEYLTSIMNTYAVNLKFELAATFKSHIDNIRDLQSRTTIVSQTLEDVDVFAHANLENKLFINYFSVSGGCIVQTRMLELTKQLDETEEEIRIFAIHELRLQNGSEAKEIVTTTALNYPDTSIKITIPKAGDKKKLIDLATKNVLYYKQQYIQSQQAREAHSTFQDILKTIQKDFRLSELPLHIECFDNSNFQGDDAVSALVVFRNAKPSKKDYRIFNVKTVQGPNDYATMEEVVYRRYKRMIDENQKLPQLIIIDGGKGQLNSAMISIEKLGLRGKVTVCSIAKQLEEIYFPEDPIPLHIDKKSISLKVIQQLRNEAHRFGITRHRTKRDKNTLQTALTAIEGVGKKTAELLLIHFKSVKKIKKATLQEFETVLGKSRAEKVFIKLRETKQ